MVVLIWQIFTHVHISINREFYHCIIYIYNEERHVRIQCNMLFVRLNSNNNFISTFAYCYNILIDLFLKELLAYFIISTELFVNVIPLTF
jgi:hypothetical protein